MLSERNEILANVAIAAVQNMIEQNMTFEEAEKVLILAGEILQQRKKDLLVEMMEKENLTIENIVCDIPNSQVKKMPGQLYFHSGYDHGWRNSIPIYIDNITSNDSIYWQALKQKRDNAEGIRLWGVQLVPPTSKKTHDPE